MFPPAAVARNFRELKDNVATLVGLQVELFRTDMHDCRRDLRGPAVIGAAAMVLCVGSVPVLLLGLADGLAALTALPRYLCLEVTALAALIVAAAASYYAWRRLSQAATAFRRSQEELQRNLRWLKRAIDQEWNGSRRASVHGVADER